MDGDWHNVQEQQASEVAAADSFQNAHTLLGSYPMSSVTPTTHVARHLATVVNPAPPASFSQAGYYMNHASFQQPSPSHSHNEYAHELAYLASCQHPAGSQYWENTRNQAYRLIREQVGPSYPFPAPAPSTQHNSYPTNALAQSLIHHLTPTNAYPTPPPPNIPSSSSSSLANALGTPPNHGAPTASQSTSNPAQFFESFLASKVNEIRLESHQTQPPAQTCPSTPPARRPFPVPESPDPLALSSATTPRKRKSVVELSSPSIKRIHSNDDFRRHQPTTPLSTPSTVTGTSPHTPVPPTPTSNSHFGKTKLTPYVQVPRLPWLTPTSTRKTKLEDDSPNDLGGYGTPESSPTKPSLLSSGRRTGDRDERGPLEKFTSLAEDIFEAEDNLLPDVDISDLPGLFSRSTIDCSRPLLHPDIIRKLTKRIGQVARPSKRNRSVSGTLATPRGKGRMTEVDIDMLSRLLRILNRTVKAGEDIDPFSQRHAKPPSPVKKKKASSKSQDTDHEVSEAADVERQLEVTEEDVEKTNKLLEGQRDTILASECCIALLSSDRLTKQLYSEELITLCLGSIKNILARIIYPFFEDGGATARNETQRRLVGEIFQSISAVLPRINNLVNAESVSMSDSIIIQAVYISIGPFFVVDGTEADSMLKAKKEKDNVLTRTLGRSAMRGLRLDALALIRSIFANREDQRGWIVEEILMSLIKLSDTKQKVGQFRLRDGRSIRTVSALLLQLVQTSAHDVRVAASRIQKARNQKFALKRQESTNENNSQRSSEDEFLDEHDNEEIRLYSGGLESAIKVAKTIIVFLTQRSGKSKSTKNANEAEYRTILDNLIHDLLVVLHWPEWPAASLLLSITCKYMVSSLDDVKTSNSADSNGAKSIALDHLGVIAARIRSNTTAANSRQKRLKPLDETVSGLSLTDFDRLLAAHQEVAVHLGKRASEDQAFESAIDLTAATFGLELAHGLRQVGGWIEDPSDEDFQGKDATALPAFGQKLKDALKGLWKDQAPDVFDIGSQEEAARVDRLSQEIGAVQGLKNMFQPMLNVILMALDAPAIFMRTKALRALGQVVTSDANILSTGNVRAAIESHLLDSSSAVRDAAVELIGKYMIEFPEVAEGYYPRIADRIADTGIAVRKRVIKLLKSYYGITMDVSRKVDIIKRLVLRMMDEDETVKDLALKSVEELWFPALSSASPAKSRSASPVKASQEKSTLLSKVAIIMGVSANFHDRQSPLEDLLHKIITNKSDSEAAAMHQQYVDICEVLIDGLIDASDLPGFTVINCIRTIYLFTSSYPAVLSGSNASTLLPYLKNATTAEEQATSDYLLKIFRASIPHMPKTTAKFGQELQLALQPMVTKPSGVGGVSSLQETVSCLCAVVQHLTHDFASLVGLLRSCNARVQQALNRPDNQPMNQTESRQLSVLIFIIALLGEHCDFDRLRIENPTLGNDISTISQLSITEHLYQSLLRLHDKYDSSQLRSRILQCLGFLFRAHPTLMTMEPSAKIMDHIFNFGSEESQARLLKIIQDFLVNEAAKHAAKEKENNKKTVKQPTAVNMEELVGNTDGFADSGVSSAVVQRYFDPILKAALSQNTHIQASAIDILTFTVKQGLAHPLQSFPVIVALETSPTAATSNRASALHSTLHSKHSSLLNSRYLVSARASYDYQAKLHPGGVRGFRIQSAPNNMPVALLQRWYSLVREKRPTRQDFLKALTKIFHEKATLLASQDDIDFTRYMAENFATFEYKTLEEVLTVISHLTAILSTTGLQLLETLSPQNLLANLHAPNPDAVMADGQLPPPPPEAPSEKPLSIPLMRGSVIVAMIMVLKAYLKNLYSLSEEKCSKFVVGKKSTAGDKAATRKSNKPITWNRLKYAQTPILTSEHVQEQKYNFLTIWNEDGVTAEPEDDFAA